MAIGIKAFDVGEVEKNFIVYPAESSYLFVPYIQIAGFTRFIQVTRHVNEFDVGIIILELSHKR